MISLHRLAVKTLVLWLLLFYSGRAWSQDFDVESFSAEVWIHQDGYFEVTEKYDVLFTQPKHGLLRDITTQYNFTDAEGNIEKRKIKIKNIEVPGHQFSVTPEIAQKFGGVLQIKIGNPNQVITGRQSYEIRYRVYDALIFEDDLAEFYWNLKPSQWNTVFHQMSFSIQAPENAVLSPENSFLYSGVTGSSEISDQFEYQYNGSVFSGNSKPEWTSAEGESATALVKIPANLIVVKKPALLSKKDLPWIITLLGLLLVFGIVWLLYGQDKKAISLTSYYPPEGVDPAMAGYLINDRDDTSDLIALIPKWGAEGLITIEEIPKKNIFSKGDTRLTRLGSLSESAPSYEKTMFEGLWSAGLPLAGLGDILKEIKKMGFGSGDTITTQISTTNASVLMSSLKNTFYLSMNRAKTQLKKKARSYYEMGGEKAKILSTAFGILLFVGLFPLFLYKYGLLAGISTFVVTSFILLTAKFMRKKNSLGTKVLSELKGFRQFIKLAEINKIKMLLAEDPQYFEKTMSYALAFGLLNQWAKKFDGLDLTPPQWYHSSDLSSTRSFGMNHFAQSFAGSMAIAGAAMVSSPGSSGSGSSGSSSSSSGGGSSGGGFGGGGGGSW